MFTDAFMARANIYTTATARDLIPTGVLSKRGGGPVDTTWRMLPNITAPDALPASPSYPKVDLLLDLMGIQLLPGWRRRQV